MEMKKASLLIEFFNPKAIKEEFDKNCMQVVSNLELQRQTLG